MRKSKLFENNIHRYLGLMTWHLARPIADLHNQRGEFAVALDLQSVMY